MFYDIGNGFNEKESLKIDVSPLNEIQSIVFTIPGTLNNIIGFRIDTGSITKEIKIEKISLKTEHGSFSWEPQEILDEFSGYADYSLREVRGTTLYLKTMGNDPQLTYTGAISDKINMINTGKNIQYSIISVVLFLLIFILPLCIKKDQKLRKFTEKQKYFLVLFFVSFLAYLLWIIAFFPGIMSFDSLSHWEQATSGVYDNAHPFLYSFFISFLQLIWNSPAIVALFQIGMTSFVLAYSLNFFLKQGVSKIKIGIVFLVFIILPSIGIYNITLWKDVLFAQLITLLAMFFVAHITDKETVRDRDMVLIGLLTILIANIRHNGIIYFLIVPVLYILFKMVTPKRIIILISSIAVFYILFNIILFGIFNVTNNSKIIMKEWVRLQIIGNALNMGYIPTPRDTLIIEQILPLNALREQYDCTAVDYIKESIDPKVFSDMKIVAEFNTITNTIILHDLRSVLRDRICLFSSLIGFGDPQLQYLHHWNIDKNIYGLRQSPNETLSNFFTSYATWSIKYPQRWILWSHVTYILLYILFLIKALYRKNYALLGFIILITINIPILFVFGVARDFRYLYMIQFALPFIFLIDAITPGSFMYKNKYPKDGSLELEREMK